MFFKNKITLLKSTYFHFGAPTKEMLIFFRKTFGESSIWQNLQHDRQTLKLNS